MLIKKFKTSLSYFINPKHNIFHIFFMYFYYLSTDLNGPRFAEPIPNITVTVGRDALLACVVENLKGHKV